MQKIAIGAAIAVLLGAVLGLTLSFGGALKPAGNAVTRPRVALRQPDAGLKVVTQPSAPTPIVVATAAPPPTPPTMPSVSEIARSPTRVRTAPVSAATPSPLPTPAVVERRAPALPRIDRDPGRPTFAARRAVQPYEVFQPERDFRDEPPRYADWRARPDPRGYAEEAPPWASRDLRWRDRRDLDSDDEDDEDGPPPPQWER